MRIPIISSFFDPAIHPVPGGIKPVILISIDGWGIAPESHGNALTAAKLGNWNRILAEYPNTKLIASGEAVGLPANEVGNSEVGHLTMGVGRVIFESLLRINRSITEETFFRNNAFLSAVDHVIVNKSKLNLIGLIGSGNVHSSTEHLYALLELCKRNKLNNVVLHLFTDGRDAPPHDGVNVLSNIEYKLKEMKIGRIASVAGRYFALDRDNRWDRIQATYEAITSAIGPTATSAVQAVSDSYKVGKTDEFVVPTVITDEGGKTLTVDDGDACIFFNFRVDRPRELTKAFVIKAPDFETGAFLKTEVGGSLGLKGQEPPPTFARKKVPKNLFFVTMTEYQKDVPVSAIAFPTESVEEGMTKVIADHGLAQFHLAESEKERMVTYYMDGLRSEKFPGEDVKIIPSPKVGTYDHKPEMSLFPLVRELKWALAQNKYSFIVMNIANPDMVAHSGKLQATIKACEAVDTGLEEIKNAVLKLDGTIFITADHGNAEELLTFDPSTFYYTTHDGSMNTEHSNNPVPLVVINNAMRGKKDLLKAGTLEDVAPTILNFMNLPVPTQMTGKNLLQVDQGVTPPIAPIGLPPSDPTGHTE
ncbi:MAG: 2,3-bisphosphoglycerate-independent phosphoglycerate mutase [Candidatus Woesebacteria bacterium]